MDMDAPHSALSPGTGWEPPPPTPPWVMVSRVEARARETACMDVWTAPVSKVKGLDGKMAVLTASGAGPKPGGS